MKKEKIVIIAIVAFLLGIFTGTFITVIKTSKTPIQYAVKSNDSLPQIHPSTDDAANDPKKSSLKEQALKKETRLNPNNPEVWILLGDYYFETKQYINSIEAYKRSLDLDPDNPDVLTDMGIMFRKTGKPQKAVELFRKASMIDPHHAQSLFNLGIVLRVDLKDTPGAIESWEKYLQVAPNNVHAGMVRAWVEELKKEVKEKKISRS